MAWPTETLQLNGRSGRVSGGAKALPIRRSRPPLFFSMRINRYLAAAGCGSRRACEELVRSGRVTLNGRVVEELSTQVAPGDVVKLGTRKLSGQAPVYLAVHKPRGILTTCADPGGRRTILELLPDHFGRIFHVGRLDKESEGLLLLTNDGQLAQRLTHPSHSMEKEYEVSLNRPLPTELMPKLLRGFAIEGGQARMEKIFRLAPTKFRVVLHQGLKRQIRLMFYQLGCEVVRLKRTRIGPIRLGEMPAGVWRHLTRDELRKLQGKPVPGKRPRASRASQTANEAPPPRPA
jgi:23S rRNA pseudouridine2605 synthase